MTMNDTGKNLLRAAAAFAVALVFAFLAFLHHVQSPAGTGAGAVTLDIPKRATVRQIADGLGRHGLLKSRFLFYALVYGKGLSGRLQAGEYEFSPAFSPLKILGKMVRGEVKTYEVTIPEDLTIREIAGRIGASMAIDEARFMDLAADRRFLSSLGIDAPTAEGYLFPETYRFTRSMSAEDMFRSMVREWQWRVTPDLRQRAAALGLSTHELMTLASLIGKESRLVEEKPLVSAVFHNRLKKKMRLESDPTAVYSIEKTEKNVTSRDLRKDTAHNTYRIAGLPPGPIANPGIDSIHAALNPAPVDHLYFVSKNDGSHHFSSTLAAHRQAVIKYQINKKKI
ncbi:MAG TPA: endolytic transglycosylase MltG [Syntrophales bacterium]|nr:endolytic transglycosylase MltG [Syntrophales bacterium]